MSNDQKSKIVSADWLDAKSLISHNSQTLSSRVALYDVNGSVRIEGCAFSHDLYIYNGSMRTRNLFIEDIIAKS